MASLGGCGGRGAGAGVGAGIGGTTSTGWNSSMTAPELRMECQTKKAMPINTAMKQQVLSTMATTIPAARPPALGTCTDGVLLVVSRETKSSVKNWSSSTPNNEPKSLMSTGLLPNNRLLSSIIEPSSLSIALLSPNNRLLSSVVVAVRNVVVTVVEVIVAVSLLSLLA